ncbi:MAG: hypothetical protein E7487_09095 [Ruminococcaceae bacterium]|nr:hypothetical protein [Oscillospiraceae bacterium]
MKIMVYNTQHCADFYSGKINFAGIADVIKNSGAEIVGLNEMRSKGDLPAFEDQPKILSELTSLEHYFFAKAIDCGGNNPYGNALLSKYPILSAERIFVPDPPVRDNDEFETRCLLKAKLACGLTVMVIHFGLNHSEHVNAVQTVLEHLEDEHCILMGDFNVTPENKLLDPIRARMKDAAAYFEKPLLSFPSDVPDRKIDYIFVSPDVEVIGADIPAVIASDHRPHTMEIR